MTGKVFKFEFLNAIKKKAFIISVSIMLLGLLLMGFIPYIIGLITGGDKDESYGFYSDIDYIKLDDAKKTTDKSMIEYKSKDEVVKAVENDDISLGVVFEDGKRYVYVKSNSMSEMRNIDSMMTKFQSIENREDLIKAGIDREKAEALLNTERPYETISLKQDGVKNFWFVYITVFVLYFLILTFGNMVTMTVAREKSDRTMELLITSARPKDLIRGKVYAYGLVGLLVLLILYGGAYLSSLIGVKTEMGVDVLEVLNLKVSLDQLIVNFVFFVVGYILYLYMFASAGSLVSKIEDANMAVQPIILLFVAGFMISMFSINKPGLILTIASYVPFTSPMAMVARYGVSYVTPTEVGISLIILVISTIVIRNFAIKMYRLGSLNYGTKVNFFKSIFQSIKEK